MHDFRIIGEHAGAHAHVIQYPEISLLKAKPVSERNPCFPLRMFVGKFQAIDVF